MKKLFHPITRQAALADLADLPHRPDAVVVAVAASSAAYKV